MKKIFLIVVLLSSLIFTGCNVGQTSSASMAAGTGMPGNGQLPIAIQLALGTLKLDKTEYPVDAAQAVILLPLWKAARSLNKSETSAAPEVAGLFKQIQNAMTSEQLEAIQAMGLTMQNLPSIAQELGIETGFARKLGNPGSTTIPSGSAAGAVGGPPPGDFGGMPGGGPGEAGLQTTQLAQNQSNSGTAPMGISVAFLDQVIKFLQARAQ